MCIGGVMTLGVMEVAGLFNLVWVGQPIFHATKGPVPCVSQGKE